jgi:hypothetical protein
MILGIEIALTVLGLMFLIRGKGVGKDAVSHPQYRWLGGFCLSVWIVMIVFGIALVVVYAVINPGATFEQSYDKYKWINIGIEFAIVVTYAIIATLWEKRIRALAAAKDESTATGV